MPPYAIYYKDELIAVEEAMPAGVAFKRKSTGRMIEIEKLRINYIDKQTAYRLGKILEPAVQR